MKKKILLTLTLALIFVCLFVVAVSAAQIAGYQQFEVELVDGSKITVYESADWDQWQGRLNFTDATYTEPPLDTEATYPLLDWSQVVVVDFTNGHRMQLDANTGEYVETYGTNNGYSMHITSTSFTKANATNLKKIITGGATVVLGNSLGGLPALEEVVCGERLTEIGWNALQNNVNLKTIDFSACTNFKSFGQQVFIGCTGLETITLPNTITSMGGSVFQGCTSLESINWPTGMTTIPSSTFYGCTSLANFEIPTNITSIGSSAFRGCTSLSNVTIPTNITSIGNHAFYGCEALTQVHIPASVTSIGSDCWTNCSSLTEVTFDPACPITHIYANTFSGTKITEITLPNTVTSIAQGAFSASTLTTVNLGASFNNFDAGNAGQPPLSGRNIKYLYLSDTFTAEKLRNNIFNWTDTDNANDLKLISPHLVVFYSGNKVAAEAIINKAKTGGTDGAMLNGFFASMTLLTQAEYEKAVEDGTLVIGTTSAPARYMVYGYNKCEAFYKGEHNKSEVESKFVGQDYVTDFVNASTCTRCALNFIVGEPICGPLFDDLGYSTEDDGTAFAYAIIVNSTNIDKYIEVTGDTLVYGFIVGLYAENSTGDIINANGEAQIANSLVFDFTEPRYDNLNRFELKFTNITNLELGLYCNAYVINDTDVSYIGAVTEEYKAQPITFAKLPKKDEE